MDVFELKPKGIIMLVYFAYVVCVIA